MAHRIEWLLEGRVIIATWMGNIRDNEILDADSVILGMIRQFPQNTVHIVTDFTGLKAPPSMFSFRNSKAPAERNFGWAVTYGYISPLVRTILTVMAATFRVKHRMVTNRDDALKFLQRVDKTLPQ